jgi:mRNA interferase MazF
MRRGELWWAALDDKRPVVLLSDGPGQQIRMARIVAPATAAERQGFVLMSGEQAVDADERRRIVNSAGPEVRAFGIEVFFGAPEGLAETGVVRVALPLHTKIFCTWILTLGDDYLIERIGVLSPRKQHELDIAMALSGTG